MKLFSTIIVSSCLAAQAFGVKPVVSNKGLAKPALVTHKSPLRQKNAADISPLFRDPTITRGGATIPGLQAYSDALDKKPITMKAITSLVGWFLGDLLAQVSIDVYCGDIVCQQDVAIALLLILKTLSRMYLYRYLLLEDPSTTSG